MSEHVARVAREQTAVARAAEAAKQPHLQWWEKKLLEDAARRAAELEAARERARNPAPSVREDAEKRWAETKRWLARQCRYDPENR